MREMRRADLSAFTTKKNKKPHTEKKDAIIETLVELDKTEMEAHSKEEGRNISKWCGKGKLGSEETMDQSDEVHTLPQQPLKMLQRFGLTISEWKECGNQPRLGSIGRECATQQQDVKGW